LPEVVVKVLVDVGVVGADAGELVQLGDHLGSLEPQSCVGAVVELLFTSKRIKV
jgi:hypothetical protein